MAESKLRKSDESGEKEVGKFLDHYFYPVFTENLQRINNSVLQVKGIDTLFHYQGNEVICDEKTALHYINVPLSTFAFELWFMNRRSVPNIGWFLDDNKLTTHYLLCWVRKCKKTSGFTFKDIEEVEVGLVDRWKLADYFNSIGWTKDKLIRKAYKLNESATEYGGDIKKDGFRFFKSRQLAESPVNIIVDKPILLTCSDNWWFVKKPVESK